MTFDELLAELTRLGVRLEAHNDRLRYHPRERLTPALLDHLRAHKPALLAALATPTGPCPRCGATEYRDTVVHGGESVRCDCAKCGRTMGFPMWYGISSTSLIGYDPGGCPAGNAVVLS